MGNKPLSDDELLDKCGTDEIISSTDLGIQSADSSGLVMLSEGFNVLAYSDDRGDNI